jgi:nitroreductase
VSEQRKPLPRDRRGPSQRTVLSDEGVDRGRHLGREGGGATGRLYASVDTGFIGQNVCLFCASEGLVTVFRGSGPAVRDLRADSGIPARKRNPRMGLHFWPGSDL